MAIQMTNERKEAYVEVVEILKHMDKKYVEKIPKKLKDFFERNCSKDYIFNLNTNKPLMEQNLKTKTLAILGMLNVNYWYENQELKQKLLEKYYEEEMLYQQELREKYNPDNIFQNNSNPILQQPQTIPQEKALVEVKEGMLSKFIKKLKNIFYIK